MVAESSVALECLSLNVSFVSAQEFFNRFMVARLNDPSPQPYWPVMTSLALTSDILLPEESAQAFTDLFLAAGIAAFNMPALETLEIWFCGRTTMRCNTAVFRYERSRLSRDGQRIESVLTAMSSPSHPIYLHRHVIRQWGKIAQRHSGRDLVVGTGQPEELNRYSSTLDYLKLRHLILHPVSLKQIQAECRHGSTSGQVFYVPRITPTVMKPPL
ncbi:hypothetical protein NKR19_g111 [Coniochaeta hoffmannii]|uniref:DUF6546 domain-containing protein n=1 Tax=Coniochaeta hoffmannii TaxID=91930 RepID=A0AA38SKW3_9PEZI|nr:hypothetical protein NKR19_g111 [Coniochaeta hoffmannii]